MIDFTEIALLMLVALVAIGVGANTIWRGRNGEVRSLSRISDRLISQHSEPVLFWATMSAGFIWFLLGFFLLVLSIGMLAL
jgi:hypothetical protein